jgi:hypothetical protein
MMQSVSTDAAGPGMVFSHDGHEQPLQHHGPYPMRPHFYHRRTGSGRRFKTGSVSLSFSVSQFSAAQAGEWGGAGAIKDALRVNLKRISASKENRTSRQTPPKSRLFCCWVPTVTLQWVAARLCLSFSFPPFGIPEPGAQAERPTKAMPRDTSRTSRFPGRTA